MTLIHFPNPDTTMNLTSLVNMKAQVNIPQITLTHIDKVKHLLSS